MKDNISDFPGYYVTVDGKVYSRKNNRHGYLLNKYEALFRVN